jgi:hypothetical protein
MSALDIFALIVLLVMLGVGLAERDHGQPSSVWVVAWGEEKWASFVA